MDKFLPKRGSDEVAAEIDVPFELRAENGDLLSITITKSGTVEMRAVALRGDPELLPYLGTFVVEGLPPEGAQAVAKGFWGGVWNKVKAAARAAMDMITFDGGQVLGTCRVGGSIQTSGGKVTGGMVTVGCNQ